MPPGRAARALGSHSRLLSRAGAPATRGREVGQPRGKEGAWVGGTSSLQPHPVVSTGPRGQMASPRPGPWLSLIRMSYERVEWAAAGGGGAVKTIAGRPQDNGSHVPWGQQSFVTQWTSRGQQLGQLLPPTRAGRVFKSFPGCVFLRGSQSPGRPGGHLMLAWWAEGPGPATTEQPVPWQR